MSASQKLTHKTPSASRPSHPRLFIILMLGLLAIFGGGRLTLSADGKTAADFVSFPNGPNGLNSRAVSDVDYLAGGARSGAISAAYFATLYVDNPGDYAITNDVGVAGLSDGDTVTWNPGAGSAHGGPVTGLIFGATAFGTIQSAVNAAAAGDTIRVAPGTFIELVTVNKTLTLLGNQNGVDARTRVAAPESIVSGEGGRTSFYLTANDVVIDGFTAQGQTHGFLYGAGVYFGAGTSGAQLLNNIIQNNVVGLFLSNAPSGNQAVIRRNLFSANNQSGSASGTGIYSDQFVAGGALANVLIDSNKFTGHTGGGASINLSSTMNGSQSNVTISNNEFAGESRAMVLFNVVSSSITGNYIHDSTWDASADLRIFEGNNNLTITGNTLINGAGSALRVTDAGSGVTASTNITVNCNRIVNYGVAGAIVDPGGYTGALDLENNWWGCNAGPGGAGCNTVSGSADFTPWLVLALSASPPNPMGGGTSTLTANLKMNSAGDVAACGGVPDGAPVTFAATGGTVNPTDTTTTGGMAMTTYTADQNPGPFMASATVDNQTVTIGINIPCPTITITPNPLPSGAVGVNYSQTLTATGANQPVTFALAANNSPPPGLTLSTDGVISGVPTVAGSFTFDVTVNGCAAAQPVTVVINARPAASVAAPSDCIAPGDTLTVTLILTNAAAVTQSVTATANLPAGLVGVAGSGAATVGAPPVITATSFSFGPAMLAPGATATVTYLAQVSDLVATGASLCVNTNVVFGDGPAISAQACATVDCPAVGPGEPYPAESAVSDQKAGSVLIYNIYTSNASDPNSQNTRISLTNIDPKRSAFVHLFFVDGQTCSVADNYVCLTPNQTTTFLTSDVDPGTTGYLVAVAVDDKGCPTNFNYLIGDEYAKFASGHAANLGAEAISALAGGLPRCDENSVTAQLNFDGVSYNPLPRVLALSNIPSRADGNDTMLVLNRIGGDLTSSAATLTNVFGNFYDDTENSLSFSFNPRSCQVRSSITNSFPRIAPRFDQFVPSGRSGWLKLFSVEDQAILGASINFNGNVGSPGAFSQGHNLHKLTLTTSSSYTIPIFPPSC